LILDKGNHRVFAVGADGKLLFQVGTCANQIASRGWIVPGMGFEANPLPKGTIRDYPSFAFLYYPVKILGNSEDALYVWEPSSQKLKRLLFGNLFPISFSPSGSAEWISADVSGFVGWSPSTHRMQRYNCLGELQQEVEIAGSPIFSNLPLNQIWTQTRNQVQRWIFDKEMAAEASGNEPQPQRDSALRRTAETATLHNDEAEAGRAVSDLLQNLHAGIHLVHGFLSKTKESLLGENEWSQWREELQKLKGERFPIEKRLHRALHHRCLGVLELRLLSLDDLRDQSRHVTRRAGDWWDTLFKPLREQFGEIQHCIDDLFMFRVGLLDHSDGGTGRMEELRQCTYLADSYLFEMRDWLYDWSGIAEGSKVVSLIPSGRVADSSHTDSSDLGHALRHPASYRYTRLRSCFREVRRISLAQYSDGPPMRPCCLTEAPEEGLFVSLFGRHQVLHLDRRGTPIEFVGEQGDKPGEIQGPAGLALDGANRLWIADSLNHRIQVFDRGRGTVQVIGKFGHELGQFYSPGGLCSMPDGSILVADSGNRRIVRITSTGVCALFYPRKEKGSGDLRYPSSLYADPRGNVWCADPLKHQVLKLDQSGHLLRTIGGFGLGNEGLIKPVSVAVLHDGNVAVVQNELNRCLRVFTPEGDELGALLPDYEMGHMLVRGKRLLVTAWDADSIYVYERI
jgi:hypothetical protein